MRFIVLLLGLVLAATTPAYPEADTQPLFKLPQDIEFTGPSDQLQTAVIFGDPTKPGLYVERFRLRLGLKLPPHWHPDYMRNVVVLSGRLYYAFVEGWDEARLNALPTVSFYY